MFVECGTPWHSLFIKVLIQTHDKLFAHFIGGFEYVA